MDRRIIPANSRVADRKLQGQVQAERYVDPQPLAVSVPVADILGRPGGARDRQLLSGETFMVLEDRDGYAFGYGARDGYVGYIASDGLEPVGPEKTHFVSARSTHVYPEPDFKSPEIVALPFGARIAVIGETASFYQTTLGYIPRPHLTPVGFRYADPTEVARLFLGVPYLWGGNSVWGIDCSGLVQVALMACGIDCPGDSDLQEQHFAAAASQIRPSRLYFWKGHVALAVDDEMLIHANAFHMSVTLENTTDAIRRITDQGDGEVTLQAGF